MTLNGVMALFCVISANSGIASGRTAQKFTFAISSPDEFLYITAVCELSSRLELLLHGKCPSTVAVFCEFCFDYIRFLQPRRPVQSRSNPLSVNQSWHPCGPHQSCTQRPQLTAIPAARYHTRIARLPDTYKKKAACCE